MCCAPSPASPPSPRRSACNLRSGGMPERPNGTVLKTVVRKHPGFESQSLRSYLVVQGDRYAVASATSAAKWLRAHAMTSSYDMPAPRPASSR